jgi:dolichol-phosphate mannosyltransferase
VHVQLSLVIPTYNERANIAHLLAEVHAALDGLSWEAVFVDDSTDGTDGFINDLAATDPRIVLVHRADNRGGLAGAVVEGFSRARGTYICVLDADLQHPPARIPEMLGAAQQSGADIVIASRYVPGGSASGLDGPLRQLYSRGLRRLTKMVFPRRLGGIGDPLGGYFLLHRRVLHGSHLRPIGYKILLEILVRCPWRAVREVPYHFEARHLGTSKADLLQGLRFFAHLRTLVWHCSPGLLRVRRCYAPVRPRQTNPRPVSLSARRPLAHRPE